MRGRQAGRCCYQDESEKNGEYLKFFARHTVVQCGQLSDVSAEGRGERLGEPPSDDILRRGRQIAIDCACAYDGKLGCLCLDTLEEIYV